MLNIKHEHKDNTIANCFILTTVIYMFRIYSTKQDAFNMSV